MKRIAIFSCLFLFCFSLFIINQPQVGAFSQQIIQRGATGDDVIELQSRLQYNGYYHGRIDGVYGWSTYWSVKNFQQEFGLDDVDGLVGPKTKDMLERATKFNKDWVHQNLKNGKRFTHYGGMPLEQQVAPVPETVEKAKKAAQTQWAKQKPKFQQPPDQQQQQPPDQQQQQQPDQQQQPPDQQQQQQPDQQQQQPPEQQQQPDQQQQQQPEQQPEQQPAQQEDDTEEADETPTAMNMPGGFSENDIQLMSNAVYGEARGEPFEGQVAVAAVIINRLNSPTFPNTVSGVIFEPLAFTAVADGQIWLTPNETARRAVLDAINGQDPSEGATYYFNPDTATSGWIWGRPQIKRIGKHIFCD